MADGFAGGFASGLRDVNQTLASNRAQAFQSQLAGLQLGQGERRLDIAERGQAFEQMKAQADAILKSFGDRRKELVELAKVDPEKALRAAQAAAKGLTPTSLALSKVLGTEIDLGSSLINSVRNVPTPQDTGKAAGQQKIAESEITGVPVQSAQTKTGKLIQDRELFVRQFGEDSPQVKSFDEASSSQTVDFKDVAGLRKEFTKNSGNFVAQKDSFSKVVQAAQNPSPQNDVALVFGFMKTLDPISVVREGEQATARNTAGVPERVRNLYNKLLTGENLTPEQRKGFVKAAAQAFTEGVRAQAALEQQFTGISARNGFNTADVVLDFMGDFRAVMPPDDEPTAVFVGFDEKRNPIFERKNNTFFKVTK